MEDVADAGQRFQVKISGKWNDYNAKEDELLKVAFEHFVRKVQALRVGKLTEKSASADLTELKESGNHNSRYKEFVIKGRRYLVDFMDMKQVRKDNKKEYLVRPPASCGENLELSCESCKKPYNIRDKASRSFDNDYATFSCCQECCKPIVEKEDKQSKAEKERNPKQREKDSNQLQPCRVLATILEKAFCAYCQQPFQSNEAIYLGAVGEHCQPCHKQCAHKVNNEALQAIAQANVLLEQFAAEVKKSAPVKGEEGIRKVIEQAYRSSRKEFLYGRPQESAWV